MSSTRRRPIFSWRTALISATESLRSAVRLRHRQDETVTEPPRNKAARRRPCTAGKDCDLAPALANRSKRDPDRSGAPCRITPASRRIAARAYRRSPAVPREELTRPGSTAVRSAGTHLCWLCMFPVELWCHLGNCLQRRGLASLAGPAYCWCEIGSARCDSAWRGGRDAGRWRSLGFHSPGC